MRCRRDYKKSCSLNYMNSDLLAWLGSAAEELTTEQIERVRTEAAAIEDRYPDPDDFDKREAALSATVQYLLGETTANDARQELTQARSHERTSYVTALQIAVMMVRDGGEKKGSAEACGIDRMGLLKALGER